MSVCLRPAVPQPWAGRNNLCDPQSCCKFTWRHKPSSWQNAADDDLLQTTVSQRPGKEVHAWELCLCPLSFPGSPRHARITVYVCNLHFVALKLICLCDMLMKFMKILVNQGATPGMKLFSQVIWSGACWCSAATATEGPRWGPPAHFTTSIMPKLDRIHLDRYRRIQSE